MLFRDRAEAGRFLSRELFDAVPELRTEPVTVLGIPRGGVPVAAPIAAMLHAPLDVFIARKLGAPGHEELAIGAVAADGTRVLDQQLVRVLRVSESYIEKTTAREIAEAQRRLALFRGTRAPPQLADRAVILVDDGLATGATARAALTVLLAAKPLRLVFAAPVASLEGAEAVATGTPLAATGRREAERGGRVAPRQTWP